MFEIIGIALVCWIVFKIIKGVFGSTSKVRSQEYGKEAKHIATKELKVPIAYYNHLIINDIDPIKDAALKMREDKDFKNCSWPRLLAIMIYGEFHQDCQQWKLGNPIPEQLFIDLGITSEEITNELRRDGRAVMYGCL